VRYVSHTAEFLREVDAAFGRGLDDTARVAAALPGSPSDLRAERSGQGRGRIGSSKPYAKAQEMGAFIRPKRARALKFRDGTFRMQARIPAKRYLQKAAARWPDLLTARLREVGR